MLHLTKLKKLKIPQNFVEENLNMNNTQVHTPVQITTHEPEIALHTIPPVNVEVTTPVVKNNIQLALTNDFIQRTAYNTTGISEETSPGVYNQIIQEGTMKVCNSLSENNGNYFNSGLNALNSGLNANKTYKIGSLKVDQNVALKIQEESKSVELPASVTEISNNEEMYNIENVYNVDKHKEALELFRIHKQKTFDLMANDPDLYVNIDNFSTIDTLERNILKFIVENLDVNIFSPLVSFLKNTNFTSDSFIVVLNCLFPILLSIGFFRFF